MLLNNSIQELMILLPALIAALTFHELSHGLMAYALGDSTSKNDGRLSLNPIRHIDPVGLLCILVVGFGWAKPVMVDPNNLKNPKVDMALISIVGPLSNFLMAFLGFILVLFLQYRFPQLPVYVINALWAFNSINILLGAFNLIPIPPLDGSKVIAGLLPNFIYERLPRAGHYGMIILLIAMFTGITMRILRPVTTSISMVFLTWALEILNFLLGY